MPPVSKPANYVYIITPITTPTTARRVAALPLYLMAPLVAEALGLLLLADAEGLEEDVEELELLAVAIAAAWKASKLFSGVGLTAKTIPCAQCPV